MPKDQIQLKLAKNQPYALNLEDAEIDYQAQFIEAEQAWQLFQELLEQTNWRQDYITLYGKTHKVPRLTRWVADAGLDYSYSNITLHPASWTDTLLELRQQVEQASGQHFNSVLLNYYRSGQDCNGWHSDDEPELGDDPVIASLSLGGARDFRLRHKFNKALQQTVSLEHGSLLLMRGNSQRCWQHHVPRRANAAPRINLTFRTIFPLTQA
ncbi:MAG: alpha-ketoglutarate-dependent dioxygenase AlkB [Gammaproteobacteria bacterium]|nr:alpha-ketoglutarate-dependent dioxygenase AlkB [Gammaproteobacteria bacterium]